MGKFFLLFIALTTFLFANQSILIINSYHKGYEWSDLVVSGIEKSFYSHTNIDMNILYMDSKRITSTSLGSFSYSEPIPNARIDGMTVDKFTFLPSCFETIFCDRTSMSPS